MIRKPLTALTLAATILAPGMLAGCSTGSTPDKVDLGVSAIVFMKRAHTTVGDNSSVIINVSGGNGQVIDYLRYVPGGSLNMLQPPRADGNLINLTSDFPSADFNGLDVSFDAKQVVFSMKRDGSDHYHIYTVQLSPDTAGKYETHQLTNGDYDDFNPVYMPGGRIIFSTNQMYTEMGTRADEYNHGRIVSQLMSITVDGGDADRHFFSQNLSHTVAAFPRYDGKVGYSRWEHLGPVNDVKVFTANPDGTQMLGVAGQGTNGVGVKPTNSLINVKEISPNVMVAIGTTRNRTIHSGTLLKIDARNHNDPVCLDPQADYTGHVCLDSEHATFEMLTPDVPGGNGPSAAGRYREPTGLPDGRIMVSWADGPVNDLNETSMTPPNFGIYVFDPKTQKNQLVYDDRQMWDVGAQAVVTRKEPPYIGDLAKNPDTTQPVRLGSVDVRVTNLNENVNGAQFTNTAMGEALKGAVKVRIIEGFSSEGAKGVTLFGLTMHEGGAILGEADVYSDGSWLANIPPYVPVHLQPIDKFGLAIRSQGLWIQGMPGEDRRCVGCHESRTASISTFNGGTPTVAEQHGPQNYLIPVGDRVEYPWNKNDVTAKPFVQDMLTQKCASCHNETKNGDKAQEYYVISFTDPVTGTTSTYQIPRLDLSDRPITVYYDMQVNTYNASYVSLFYPAAMEMGDVKLVSGTIPPMWAIPANARGSEAIKKMNVKASDGTMAYAGGKMHPEDVGAPALTDAERQEIIRSIDMGGQYYARQNTGFVPFANDPVSGKSYK